MWPSPMVTFITLTMHRLPMHEASGPKHFVTQKVLAAGRNFSMALFTQHNKDSQSK